MSQFSEPDGSPSLRAGKLSGASQRREFLKFVGWSGLALSGGLGALNTLRFLLPVSVTGPSSRIRVGSIQQFPVGSKRFVSEINTYLIRSELGLHAMSAMCTHLGCAVNALDWGYLCPCHGSMFDPDGAVLSGPAVRPLAWYAVDLGPDGQLIVNTQRQVSPGTKLEL